MGMFAVYVDLKKAFDSMHYDALWDLLRLRGISARITELLIGLRSGTVSVCEVWWRNVQFFSCKYSSEGGERHCPVTLQHFYGKSCGPKAMIIFLPDEPFVLPNETLLMSLSK